MGNSESAGQRQVAGPEICYRISLCVERTGGVMKLKPDDKEVITKWLGERCGQMRCFCCGHSRWQLLEESSIQIGFDTDTSRFHSHSFFT